MIFYFTGTGNSLYAAKKLDSDIYSIPQCMKEGPKTYKAERIGIVCPVYGHEMPDMVKKFVGQNQFQTDYLYVVLTYGKRHANAVELAEKELAKSSKKADYITTVVMVDNFLPVFDMKEEKAIDKNVEGQLAAVKKDIDEKVHAYQEVTQEDRDAHQGYLKLVDNAPETVWTNFEVNEACVGCGICAKVCPAGCIKIIEQKSVHTGKNCQACYACVHACPTGAIHIKPTLGFTEKNPNERYRNPNIELAEIINANNQSEER